WERKIEQVHLVCDMVLKRHLGHRHFYYRASDTAYVIVFDMNDKGTAAAACRAVSQEILTRLLGREAANRQITAEINLAEIFPEDVAGGKSFADAIDQRLSETPPERVFSSQANEKGRQDRTDERTRLNIEPQFNPIHLKEKNAGVPGKTKIDLQSLLDLSERGVASWQNELARQDSRAGPTTSGRASLVETRKNVLGVTSTGVEIAGIE